MPAVHSLRRIPSGDAGIVATLNEMCSIVRAWKTDPSLRALAAQVTSVCGTHHNWTCEIETLHEWVRDQIRFLPDVAGVETLQTPDLTLEQGSGDCDDQAILLASLLQSIGHPARFVALDLGAGGYSHVLVETLIGNNWIAAETTEPGWVLSQRPLGVVRSLYRHC